MLTLCEFVIHFWHQEYHCHKNILMLIIKSHFISSSESEILRLITIARNRMTLLEKQIRYISGLIGWWRSTVVRTSASGRELSLSCARLQWMGDH